MNRCTRTAERPSGDGSLGREISANEEAKTTARLCGAVHDMGGFFTIENPQTSLLFVYSPVKKLLDMSNAVYVKLHQCAFGLQLPGCSKHEFCKKATFFVGTLPGLDSLGTMKVVHEAQAAGHKVVSYESYCGGIPTAEQADNPLGYKFSWNPGASIKASKNTAIFMKGGERIVTNEPLKHTVICDDVSVAMKLEAYPNRDSTVF